MGRTDYWTPREEQLLRDEYTRRTTREIAAMLGRTLQAVAVKAFKIGLKKDHYGIEWTPLQLKLLRDHFPTMFNKPLAKWIGVSESTMHRKARELGLKKRPGFLEDRRLDIGELISEGHARSTKGNSSRFKKGVRNNPAGEFKPGHVASPASREKQSLALKQAWKKRKAKLELDKNLHPEKYY